MIDLYAWRTTNGLRATIALAESGLPHRVIPIDVGAGAHKTDEYRRINPASQIPALVDPAGPGGKPLVLAQSGAIVLYACQKAGRFVPGDDAGRALAMQWAWQAGTDVGGTSAAMNQVEVVSPEKVPAHIDLFRKRFLRYFGVVEQHLAGRDYLAGELSYADFVLYPNYALRADALDPVAFPALTAWAGRLAARPGVIDGMRLYTEKRG
ncbi:glutathione S-transferase family protein [Bordetella genomosp. 5]|uniref:glutathione S-transferase family protein n=1 Tax=Bordetella genomosp. 5 TaxID=1395608 RepID=UPI001594F9E6|nr:glutathione S-transferase N-terminal domain-containing protein [Bordetella genomosp. 5]